MSIIAKYFPHAILGLQLHPFQFVVSIAFSVWDVVSFEPSFQRLWKVIEIARGVMTSAAKLEDLSRVLRNYVVEG